MNIPPSLCNGCLVMKLLVSILIFASFNSLAGEAETCKGNKGAKSFLSEWREGGRVTNILTTIQGSAGDRTFGVFVQCKGFLQFMGGNYFAGMEGVAPKNNGYSDVIFFSYQRDKSDEVIYAEGRALTRSHVWSFNPNTGRYEGGAD